MIRNLLNRLYIRLDRPGCAATGTADPGHVTVAGEAIVGTCAYRAHRSGRHSFDG